jgi:hypothetical protein
VGSRRAGGCRQSVDVGATEEPVAIDVGDHERRRGREPVERVDESDTRRLGPSVHREHATAMVEPDGDRDTAGDGFNERRLGHRSRSHHDAGDPGVGEFGRIVD